MDSARDSWNDDRLDELSGRVGHLEMRMDARFNALDARFDAMQRTMLLLMASILIGFASLVATRI